MNARLKSLIHFLDDGIWRIREEEVSHLQWKAYTCLKIIYLSINQFINDRIVVRASALTYSTLLSIIPILALLFAIARGFGFDTLIESQFRSGVTGAQAELVISWINSYLEHAQSGIFIGVGLIMLLGTVLLLIDNIERSFNAIWQVKKTPKSVPTDYRLFFFDSTTAGTTRNLQRSVHLHEHLRQGIAELHGIGSGTEIFCPPYPLCPYLGYVYRTLHLHAQHESQVSTCLATGYSGRKRFSGLPVFLHQQPDMGF